jgi:hypothetical protein
MSNDDVLFGFRLRLFAGELGVSSGSRHRILQVAAANGTFLSERWKVRRPWGCFYECQPAIGPASSRRKRWRAR